MTQPLTWAGAGGRLGKGRETLGPLPLLLADGAQRMGEGLQLILDALQGAPDRVGTVQHVDGQGIRVKLHGEGALDAGSVVPREGRAYGPSVTWWGLGGHWGGGEEQGPLGTESAVPRRGGASSVQGKPRPQKLLATNRLDKTGDRGLLQGWGAGEGQAFPKRASAGPPSRPTPPGGLPGLCAPESPRSVPVPTLACGIRPSRTSTLQTAPGPRFPLAGKQDSFRE